MGTENLEDGGKGNWCEAEVMTGEAGDMIVNKNQRKKKKWVLKPRRRGMKKGWCGTKMGRFLTEGEIVFGNNGWYDI